MNSLRRLFSLLLFSIFYTATYSQTNFNIPKAIPPSPTVANFNRYGEIPVDHSTGVPNISIPIYTVQSRKLELPISLSYHAAGIKVNDRSSVVGLGWVLNAGGYIGVTKMGDGGEKPYIYSILAFKDAADFETKRDAAYAAQPAPHLLPLGPSGYYGSPLFQFGEVINNWKNGDLWDGTQSNKYNFSLPNGKSGTFRYDFKTGEVFVLPYSKIKVERPSGGIRIIDEDGTIYEYGTPQGNAGATVRNWDLTRIISADKTDEIRLVYKSQPNIYYTRNISSSIEYGAYYTYNINAWSSTHNRYVYNNVPSSITTTYESILDSIITPTTFVKFYVAGDRTDVGHGTNIYRVNNIEIRNRQTSDLIKKYTLNNSTYFGTGMAQRLKLSGISVRGNDGAIPVETYSFTYNESVPLPPVTGDDFPYMFHEDYWGYYNGTSSESNVPKQFVPTTVSEATGTGTPATLDWWRVTDRTPNHTFAAACMLQEIKYPTGGKTVFTFEPNRAYAAYWNTNAPPEGDIVGGFRIQKIENYTDDATLVETKTYEYALGSTRKIESDLYLATYRVVEDDFLSPTSNLHHIDNNRHLINSTPFLPLTADNGPPVFYGTVTEYFGTVNANIGKIVYGYVTPPAMPTAKFVTPRDIPLYRNADELDRGNYVPRLDAKVTYKNVAGTYIPVHKTLNIYETRLSDKVYFTGINVTLTTLYEPTSFWALDYKFCSVAANDTGGWTPVCTPEGVTEEYPNYYYMTDLYATQETPVLIRTINYNYAEDGVHFVTDETEYEYANAIAGASIVHLQPTQKKITSSTGDKYISTYKYPHDMGLTTPYMNMVSNNMLYPVIEETTYKNAVDEGHFLQSVKTDYSFWENGQPVTSSMATNIYPTTVSSKKGGAPYEPRLEYVSYTDQGSVATVRKASGPYTSYLYDKKGAYPIAEITNTPIKNIFFESFEDGVGTSAKGDSKTGRYSKPGGYYKALTGLDAGDYTLSYWSNTSTTWVLNVVPVTVAGSTYTINLVGQVDDVRFHPASALMSTYTYDAGVGQTSATDARHNITYYTYDSFGRLKTIWDKDKNITRAFCYNYKGEAVDCSVPEADPPPPIYARMEISNESTNPPGDPDSEYWVNTIATLSLKFYSNAACTIPYTVPSGFTVQLKKSYTILHDMLGNYTNGENNYNFSFTSGQSSYSLGTQTLFSQHRFLESENYWNDYYYYDFEVVPASGANYILL